MASSLRAALNEVGIEAPGAVIIEGDKHNGMYGVIYRALGSGSVGVLAHLMVRPRTTRCGEVFRYPLVLDPDLVSSALAACSKCWPTLGAAR